MMVLFQIQFIPNLTAEFVPSRFQSTKSSLKQLFKNSHAKLRSVAFSGMMMRWNSQNFIGIRFFFPAGLLPSMF